jgi:hypothetical protein
MKDFLAKKRININKNGIMILQYILLGGKMCTVISESGFFGRTLDVECDWGGEVVIHKNIIGMARRVDGVPLWFDAVNTTPLGARH